MIVAILIILDVIFFIVWPRPSTAVEYFNLLQANPFIGLVNLDLFYFIDQILMVPAMLGFYNLLKHRNKSIVTLFTVIGLIGIIAIFAANPAIGMLYLSKQYLTATTDIQKTVYLTAGETLLAIYVGTSYHVHIILGSIALIVISIVMLKDDTFSKATAYRDIGKCIDLRSVYTCDRTLSLIVFPGFFRSMGHPACPQVLSARKKYFKLRRILIM